MVNAASGLTERTREMDDVIIAVPKWFLLLMSVLMLIVAGLELWSGRLNRRIREIEREREKHHGRLVDALIRLLQPKEDPDK